jgi:hypothetical protein
MKQLFVASLATLSVIVFSCNDHSDHAASTPKEEQTTAATEPSVDTEQVKVIKASFTNVDAGVSTYIKTLTDDYLQIKNALANGKANEAGDASKKMYDAMKGFDKSLLTADQKKVYDQNEDDLKEHAEHISKSTNDIEHQRDHFSMMSEDMYSLVKSFSTGKALYHDHCPMAKQGKGAMWLSETKEIKNPYLSEKMPDCGNVEEEIH